MEFKDMAQMDEAFRRVAPLEGELEVKHKSLISLLPETFNTHFSVIGLIHSDCVTKRLATLIYVFR
jgi:hypothetical protein